MKRGIYMYTGTRARVTALVVLAALIGVSYPIAVESGLDLFDQLRMSRIEIRLPFGMIVVNANSILQAKSPSNPQYEWAPTFMMYVTAYSSSVDETDSTPFITASGTRTRDGVVAANIFPMGTRVRIPDLFGDKVLVVEDRMHQRFTDRIDVWMPSKWQALTFGKQRAAVEIVEL